MLSKFTLADGRDLDEVFHRKTSYPISVMFNDIGTPGEIGFGVGICDMMLLPTGFQELPGTRLIGHPEYGNYISPDGSTMVYIPRFWTKISSGGNWAWDLDEDERTQYDWIDISSEFEDDADAISNGYAPERCFTDLNTEQYGVFVDKYQCSLHAGNLLAVKGTVPMMITNPTLVKDKLSLLNVPIVGLEPNYGVYSAAECRNRAKIHDAIAANRADTWLMSVFVMSALTRLSMAHSQRFPKVSGDNSACAFFGNLPYFPKGPTKSRPLSTHAGEMDDPDLTYFYEAEAWGIYVTILQESGAFRSGENSDPAKTSHNGQLCGVCDIAESHLIQGVLSDYYVGYLEQDELLTLAPAETVLDGIGSDLTDTSRYEITDIHISGLHIYLNDHGVDTYTDIFGIYGINATGANLAFSTNVNSAEYRRFAIGGFKANAGFDTDSAYSTEFPPDLVMDVAYYRYGIPYYNIPWRTGAAPATHFIPMSARGFGLTNYASFFFRACQYSGSSGT
jgi:hypothetical protein